MQSASNSLQSEQKQFTARYYRKVELYRRYWNGSAFVWDSVLSLDSRVIKVSTAKWKLDTQGYNEWKSPSFQVEVDNRGNYFSTIEPTGTWKSGAHAPYQVELTRVRVRCGQVLPDGTQEDLYVFGGVINRPINFHDKERTATISVVGLDEILRRTSAIGIATTVTLESIGSNSGTDFTTAGTGVGDVTEVRKGTTASGSAAATKLTKGIDYTISQTNDKSNNAKVSLTVALTGGISCWATYYKWPQDKDPSWVVTQLLALGGITNYQVDPTVFSTSILNSSVQTLKADFEADTLTNIDTTYTVDSFQKKWFTIENWADNDFTSNPTWTVSSSTGWSVAGNILSGTGGPAIMSLAVGQNVGSWEIDKLYPTSGVARFWFAGIFSGFFAPPPTNSLPYGCRVEVSGTNVSVIQKPRSGSETTLISVNRTPGASDKYRVTRDSAFNWCLYIDTGSGFSQMGGTVNNNVAPGGNNIGLETNGSASFGAIYYSYSAVTTEAINTATPVLVTTILDASAGLTGWDKFSYNAALNGGTLKIETLSADNSDMTSPDGAGWVQIDGAGQILSALKRYLKARITINTVSTLGPDVSTPLVSDFTIKYLTSTTTIPLVNCANMNCWTGIQEAAKMPSYEIGFSASEKFFYRSRLKSGSPTLIIDQFTNLEKEISYGDGTDAVLNSITGTFGPYTTLVDSNSQSESHPNSLDIYGTKTFTVSSSFLPSQGADLATSAAKTTYTYTSKPRRTAQVQLKFLQQYELGDLSIYRREHKFGRWLWGDRTRRYGSQNDQDFVWYANPATNGWDITMQIVGIEFDTEPGKWRVRYDLMENL